MGNTLFFSAGNGVNGRELWALNVGGPAVPTLAIAATNANQTEGKPRATVAVKPLLSPSLARITPPEPITLTGQLPAAAAILAMPLILSGLCYRQER
ncbi:MAG: hypothetical protein GPJ12_24405 [Microcystis aeruginosa S11-01]|nr:hypothetical protein [Microcystis aeruginosa S11-01]